MFRSLFGPSTFRDQIGDFDIIRMPIFFSYPFEILGLNYVSLKRYDQNSRELLEKVVTKINIV